MTVYLLDSDTLIRAKNEHYGFDLCPGHWNWLDNEHAAGKVFSVRKVYDELLAGQDDLSDWAKQRKPFFLEPNDATRASLAEVSAWANGTQYQPNAVNLFLHKADYFGMAEGHASKMTVVTYEKSAPNSVRNRASSSPVTASALCVETAATGAVASTANSTCRSIPKSLRSSPLAAWL